MLISNNRGLTALCSSFSIYIFVFTLLLIGVYRYSGLDHFEDLLIYIVPFLIVYSVLAKIKSAPALFKINFPTKYGYELLCGFSAIFILAHWFVLKGAPLLSAFQSYDYIEIVLIRQNVGLGLGLGFIWSYGSGVILHAVLPFLVFYAYLKKKKSLWFVVLLAFLYSISLMQKSHVFMVFLPVIVLATLHRKYWAAGFFSGFVVVGLSLLLLATNPSFRPGDHPVIVQKAPAGLLSRISVLSGSIGDRMFMVPGLVVTQWFDLIPNQIPYQKGCGYRFMAPALSCQHYNVPLEAYKKLYPDMVSQGIYGSVNVASFMEDYANWGRVGLFFSGMLLAVLLWLIRGLFAADRAGEVAINIIPVLSLSSAALSTTLLSGGWMALLLLYYIFREDIQAAKFD